MACMKMLTDAEAESGGAVDAAPAVRMYAAVCNVQLTCYPGNNITYGSRLLRKM